MNNIEDVFDELDTPKTHSGAPSSEEPHVGMSAVDLVDSVSRAAFRRGIDYDRSWRRHLSNSDEPQH